MMGNPEIPVSAGEPATHGARVPSCDFGGQPALPQLQGVHA
jgi:hypothetical protein